MNDAHLSSLLEFLPIGAYRLAPDGKILYMNQALRSLFHFSESHHEKNLRWQEVLAPYVTFNEREAFLNTLHAQGWVHNFDSLLTIHTTKQQIWIREHAHWVRNEQGRAVYLEGTVEDITPEKTAILQREQRESLLQNVLRSIPDHVWVKNLDGIYLTCNHTFAEHMGGTIEEITGTQDSRWVSPAQQQYIRSMDQICLQSGQRFTMEEEFVSLAHPYGELHEVVKTPMFDKNGQIVGLLGMARNIHQRKIAETNLRATTEQLELAILGADLGRWNHDLTQTKGYFIDEVACQMLGRDPEDAKNGRAWGHLIHPDDLPLTLHAMQAHLDGETPSYRVEYRARHSDGRWIWLSSKGKVVQFSQEGKPLRMVGTLADISVRKQVEERLRETQSELQATLSALPDLLFEFDASGHYLSAHSQDPDSLILPVDEMIDKSVTEVLPADAAQAYLKAFAEAHERGRSHGIQYSLDTPTGKRWFELSVAKKPTEPWKDERFIAIVRDISERKKAEEAIQYIAFHDSLTGLPNRRLLTERLQQALLSVARSQTHGAIMFLDLDRFKQLNDTHGHEMGDLLLQEVARRLLLSIRSVDTAARLGGDEFVLLLHDLSSDIQVAKTQAQVVGNKVLASLNQPYNLQGLAHTTTPSIGVALFKNNQLAPNEVIKQADAAMYAAKAAGRNTLRFYEPSLTTNGKPC